MADSRAFVVASVNLFGSIDVTLIEKSEERDEGAKPVLFIPRRNLLLENSSSFSQTLESTLTCSLAHYSPRLPRYFAHKSKQLR